MLLRLFLIHTLVLTTSAWSYPASWWEPVDESQRHSWEILPQDAGEGEVILSKRNELGILSNFAATPFKLDGVLYASIEGLWQAMKYPDPLATEDPRYDWNMPLNRSEVAALAGHEAKNAGSNAGKMMKEKNFPYVSYRGQFFNYKDFEAGSARHYQIIYRATWAKIRSSQKARKILLKTKGLILKPDHKTDGKVPASYEYYKILMEIRDSL